MGSNRDRRIAYVAEANGWAGIMEALQAAEPGSEVVIGPGAYCSSDTLTVPSGVTLRGEDGARIEYEGKSAAILLSKAESASVINIQIDGYRGLPHVCDHGFPEEGDTSGLIEIVGSNGVTVKNCTIIAHAMRLSCIAAAGGDGLRIDNNELRGARRGIVLRSSRGNITNNSIQDGFNGIQLERLHSTLDIPAAAIIKGNRCSNHTHSGIVLFSSIGEIIENNECCDNSRHGIELCRLPTCLTEPSKGVIKGNRCNANTFDGIALQSSTSDAIEDNECQDNKLSGISLLRSDDSPDAPSDAVIKGNRCNANTKHGIALQSSTSDAIEDNECQDNEASGIILVRDPNSLDAPSDAVIKGNRCNANTFNGIELQSSTSDAIEDNECQDNKGSGITLGRFPNSPDAPSDAVIKGNRCNANAFHGIALASSTSDSIEDNECQDNKLSGISLLRSDDSPDAPSDAVIKGNRCNANTGRGILLASSTSDAIEDNECQDNKGSGITLGRFPNSPDAPSDAVIKGNRCNANAFHGIALASSTSDAIEDNECWDNAVSGIRLTQSASVIKSNRCHNNNSGILIESSKNTTIEDNDCWNNRAHGGIQLQRDTDSPSFPSCASIKGNRCHNNIGNGINVLNSEGESVSQNDCWSNTADGICIATSDNNDAPSTASLYSNRLQKNNFFGVRFKASFGSVSNSRLNKNREGNIVAFDKNNQVVRDSFLQGEGNYEDPSLNLEGTFLPHLQRALRRLLPAERTSNDEIVGLTTFLTSGSSHAFRTYWTGALQPEEPKGSLTFDPRAWTIKPASQSHQPIKLSLGKNQTLMAAIASRFIRRKELSGNAHFKQAQWAALVSPDIDDLNEIRETISAKRQSELGGFASGLRLSSAVTVELDGGERPLKEQLTEILMQERSVWGERLRTFAKTFHLLPIALIFGALIGLNVLTEWPDTPGSILASLGSGIAIFDTGALPFWLSLIAGSLSTLIVTVIAFALIDIVMPPHLRFLARRKPPSEKTGFLDETGLGDLVGFVRVDFSRFFPLVVNRAELNWQLRRLFESGDAAILILEGLERWGDDDLAFLSYLSENLPEGGILTTLLHLDGRMSLKPLIIDPVEQAPWNEGFELYLNDDEERLKLDPTFSSDLQDGDPLEDFSLLGAKDGEAAEDLRNQLADDEWIATDLLPTLPIASAPTGRAELPAKRVSAVNLQRELLEEILPAARDFFVGASVEPIALDSETLEKLYPPLGTAKALHKYRMERNRQSWRVSTGRVGYRPQIGNLVRSAWSEDEDWAEYICSAVRFGIWQRCQSVISLASDDGDLPGHGLSISRHLEAIRFLGDELHQVVSKIDCPLHGEDRYLGVWEKLRLAISKLPATPDSETIIGRYLAAEISCFGPKDPQVASIPGLVKEAFEAGASDAPVEGALEQFCKCTANRIQELSKMDQHTADNEVEALQSWQWRNLPLDWTTTWRELSQPETGRRKFLVEMLAEANDYEEIESIVKRHGANAPRTIFAMGCTAVRFAMSNDDFDRESEAFANRIAPIGQKIAQLIDGIKSREGSSRSWIPIDFAKGASGPVVGGKVLFDLLSKEDSVRKILDFIKEPAGEIARFDMQLARELKGD